MALHRSVNVSPREEGELEDGEICEDDPEERLLWLRQRRPPVPARFIPRKYRPDLRMRPNFPRGPPFLPGPPGRALWPRSGSPLGRLRYRGQLDWDRPDWVETGGREPPRGAYRESTTRKPKLPGRPQVRKPARNLARAENGVEESFEDLLLKYKQIQLELECIRNEEKKALKPAETCEPAQPVVPQSVREEKAAGGDRVHVEVPLGDPQKRVFQAFNLKPLRQKLLTPAQRDKLNKKDKHPEKADEDKAAPQPTAAKEVEKDNDEDEEEEEDVDITISDTSALSSDGPVKGKEEDEELSELQLRLLALQSASRKWQQKEQQVMKESKEKITKAKATQDRTPQAKGKPVARQYLTKKDGSTGVSVRWQLYTCGYAYHKTETSDGTHQCMVRISGSKGPVAKQVKRKQQLRTWKIQHQKEEDQQPPYWRGEEEEERRRREEEIRKIRDLSNQDEQYNRFMKLVGAKRCPRSRSLDSEHRRSLGRQGLDTLGNLYQYDNYDEVAMDTDSETNSPASSPVRDIFAPEVPLLLRHLPAFPADLSLHTQLLQDVTQRCLDPGSVSIPSPPLPPLPPAEPEQPPKPPFADEEEEEEMLLREELLKSLASKRAGRSEETSSNSGPPSPTPLPQTQQPPQGALTTTSQMRAHSAKIFRSHPAQRPLLVLPKHKAVVVHLNASDDSDSDSEAPATNRLVLGGLESMIKEARRTVEAAKPKGMSGSEKENNPMRTPDNLPDAKKIEYRRLREEIVSREKQQALKCVQSPAGSDVEADPAGGLAAADAHLTEAEDRVAKHRILLQKDEMLLKNLLQQEQKKREALKAAEAKASRLKEQLLASEKIVNANRLLLRKLQEQVHRVEHRLYLKHHQTLKLEKELAQVRAATGRGGTKRRGNLTIYSPSKQLRLDSSSRMSEQQYAELIAQKQRLQQLESVYALKIQILKEAQAQRNRKVQSDAPAAAPPPDPAHFALPQPSKHDLTQDKLVLASEDVEPEEERTQPSQPSTRRRSFRESGSFTKPKLQHLESTPSKDPVPGKPAPASACSPELILGFNMDDLQRQYQQSPGLKELMDSMSPLCGAWQSRKMLPADVEVACTQIGRTDLKPHPFEPYNSPLLAFKSYRFSPYFRTKEKLSLSSISYSNAVEPRKCFCRFDLTGTCNDDDCQWQHMRNCTLNGDQLFQDILSYSLPLIGCSEKSSSEEISLATEKYITKLFGSNKDRMGTDQKAVLLVSKVNESLGHVPPYTTYNEMRKWRPRPSQIPEPECSKDSSDEETGPLKYETISHSRLATDGCITQDDDRYFTGETDDISNLETSVLESPKDVQLWVKLAYKYLNQKENSASECLDAALNTLSRALEDNRDNPEVWCHYLTLFSRRGKREEVQEMCEMAVEYAPDYQVWSTYLITESSFEGKDYVCGRLLQYLKQTAGGDWSELLSFQLLETLLYRIQLSLFAGHHQSATAILQNALKSTGEEKCIADLLSVGDRTLAWLSYIHLTEFGSLPASLYDPANSNPSRIVCRDSLELPWRSPQELRTAPDMLVALFEDAVGQCTDETLTPKERVSSSLQLHINMVTLFRLLGRWSAAAEHCETLLLAFPQCCPLLDALAQTHLQAGAPDKARQVWLRALQESPHNAQLFYHTCKYLCSQEKAHTMPPLFEQFVASFCEAGPREEHPVNVLRYILGITMPDPLQAASVKRELQNLLPSQMSYMCLIHCLWQSVHGIAGEAVDAYEQALGTVTQEDVLQQLWLDYLLFTSSKFLGPQCKSRDLKVFTDLVQRCLSTVPTRFTLPFSSAQYWSNFHFHNKVISLYLSCLPQSQHSFVLERLRYLMPTNTELILRFLQNEWCDGNLQHVKLQSRMLSSCVPNCLITWKTAIAVERELKGHPEVRRLYRQALQKLPLCATLWKDRLLFEAAEGGKTDKLRKLVDKCREVGVRLDERLHLGSDRAEEKDH